MSDRHRRVRDVSGVNYVSEVIDTTKRKQVKDEVGFQDECKVTKQKLVECLHEVMEH